MKKLVRRTLATAITIALFSFALVGLSWAGNGPNVSDLTVIPIEGTVMSVCPYQIDTGDGIIVTVYGFGSLDYWAALDVDLPVEGDLIYIEAYTVTFSNGLTKYLVLNFTIDGQDTVIVRDEDGVPVWR